MLPLRSLQAALQTLLEGVAYAFIGLNRFEGWAFGAQWEDLENIAARKIAIPYLDPRSSNFLRLELGFLRLRSSDSDVRWLAVHVASARSQGA